MMIPSVYLIVSGAFPSQIIFAAYLDLELAKVALEGIETVSGAPARIVPLVLSDPMLLNLLDRIDRAESAYAEAEKGESYLTLKRAVGIRERVYDSFSQYIANLWKGLDHENQPNPMP